MAKQEQVLTLGGQQVSSFGFVSLAAIAGIAYHL
jgi:hypothetical protein